MRHQLFSSKDDLKISFWKNIHFGRVGGGLLWWELEDYPFFHNIYSAKCPFFYSTIY